MVHQAFPGAATIVALMAAAVFSVGCSALGSGSGAGSEKSAGDKTTTAAAPAAPTYQPVTDIPIPASTKINTERSTILGNGDRWFGRMILVLDRPTTQAFAYYQEQMATFGWETVTAIQGKVSTLSFTRGDRAATIEIGPSGLRSAEVTVTVSPRQPPAPAAPTAPAAPRKP